VNAYVHLAHFFLKWEMFRTKVVEKIKTHVSCLITFSPRKSCRLGGIVEKYGRAVEATEDNRALALCMLDNWGYTHRHTICSTYAFRRQRWLSECTSMLRLDFSALGLRNFGLALTVSSRMHGTWHSLIRLAEDPSFMLCCVLWHDAGLPTGRLATIGWTCCCLYLDARVWR
jgi:hypothetical protein